MNVAKDFKRDSLPKAWYAAAYAIIFSGLLSTVFFVSSPYSYWLDELYSVTASNQTWFELYSIILGDVHPPLYQITLKLWIELFGDSEFSTRSLSTLCTLLAAAYLYAYSSKFGKAIGVLTVLFFVTNPLVVYYANETRSYAMMLFFSTLLATNIPKKDERPSLVFLISCMALSLTHYFGFVLAGLVLAYCFLGSLKNSQLSISMIATGSLCLLWPVNHILHGEIFTKTGGNFWIEVDGPLDSISVAANAFFPKTGLVGAFLLILGLVISMIVIRYKSIGVSDKEQSFFDKGYTASVISILFLLVVAIMDMWSPISTTRNYIVLVPLVSIIFATSAIFLMQFHPIAKSMTLTLVVVFCSLSLFAAYYKLSVKLSAFQDWRGASQFVVDNHNGRNLYYAAHGNGLSKWKWKNLINNYYIDLFSEGRLVAAPYIINQTELDTPSLVIFGSLNEEAFYTLNSRMDGAGALLVYDKNGLKDGKNGGVGVFSLD